MRWRREPAEDEYEKFRVKRIKETDEVDGDFDKAIKQVSVKVEHGKKVRGGGKDDVSSRKRLVRRM
jgi:hypothetical protein